MQNSLICYVSKYVLKYIIINFRRFETLKIGYGRVSSTSQDLTSQKNKLTEYGCEKVFSEKLSGKTASNREVLQQALNYVREGDALVVTKLDRLARSVVDLGNIAENLKDKGVDLVVLEQDIDTSSASGKLMFNMIGAFAEFERDLISERCREGVKQALSKGVRFGRKAKLNSNDIRRLTKELETWEGSKVELARKYGISRATLYRLTSSKELKT